MLVETILFLTLKMKQNKFTKSVVRCEFDDLKIKIKFFLGGGSSSPKIGLDTPLDTLYIVVVYFTVKNAVLIKLVLAKLVVIFMLRRRGILLSTAAECN